jgi:hypothetical protein
MQASMDQMQSDKEIQGLQASAEGKTLMDKLKVGIKPWHYFLNYAGLKSMIIFVHNIFH